MFRELQQIVSFGGYFLVRRASFPAWVDLYIMITPFQIAPSTIVMTHFIFQAKAHCSSCCCLPYYPILSRNHNTVLFIAIPWTLNSRGSAFIVPIRTVWSLESGTVVSTPETCLQTHLFGHITRTGTSSEALYIHFRVLCFPPRKRSICASCDHTPLAVDR